MGEQVESTVMWVQQMLESVHFVDSDAQLDPGASLKSIVQPRLRHQKDEALKRSQKYFNEKKQEEKEYDVQKVFFRSQALKSVQLLSKDRVRVPEKELKTSRPASGEPAAASWTLNLIDMADGVSSPRESTQLNLAS
jgi:hypothetical protein